MSRCIIRVGHLNLRALAIRASNPQNALTQISFHSPKCLPRPNHFLTVIMHSRPTCHSAEKFLVLFSWYTFESRAAFGFFYFFSSSTTFGTPEIYFHILARNHFTFSNLPEEHTLIKDNSLATSSSSWQTEGYFIDKF